MNDTAYRTPDNSIELEDLKKENQELKDLLKQLTECLSFDDKIIKLELVNDKINLSTDIGSKFNFIFLDIGNKITTYNINEKVIFFMLKNNLLQKIKEKIK